MDHDEKLANRIKEMHTNVRHITQLGMNWFAFFVTMNYLTMGWLAKGSLQEPIQPRIIPIVAFVFVVQNGLGVWGIWKVKQYAEELADKVRTHERSTCKDASIPTRLYNWIACFLMIVLGSLFVAWIVVGMILVKYGRS